MKDGSIRFIRGTSERFKEIEHNPNFFYYLEDTQELYKGDEKLGGAY